MIARRDFLKSVSTIALLYATPAKAGINNPGVGNAAIPGFNGGRSQGQSNLVAGDTVGDFPFINILKQQPGYLGQINPSWLDSKGYPTPSGLAGAGGSLNINTSLPNQASKPGTLANPFVLTWEGNSSVAVGNASSNFVLGGNAAVLNGYGFSDGLYHGRYVWYPNYAADGSYSFFTSISSVTNYIDKLQLYYLSDETQVLAGAVFAPQFKNTLATAKFGVFRFMDWVSANGNMTTWATRKSIGYPSWLANEFRPSLNGGVTNAPGIVKATLSSLSWSAGTVTATTASAHGIAIGKNFPVRIYNALPGGYNSTDPVGGIADLIATSTGASTFTYPLASNPGANTAAGVYSANCLDFTLTVAGGYSWTNPVQGNYTPGGAAADKQTMHMNFGADCMLVQNFFASRVTGGTLTITSFSPITFNWPSLPLSNGDPVAVSTGFLGGNIMQGVAPVQNYYVVNASGNTFQIAKTPGGAALSSTDTSGDTNTFVSRLPTLNINSSAAVPVRLASTYPMVDNSTLPNNGGASPIYSTVTYDADLNMWLLVGGRQTTGLLNGIPFEVCLQLCKELGMHPMISLSPYSLDPATDFATSLASYIKTTYQQGSAPWMIPRIEPVNEVWNNNPGINYTPYCAAKGYKNWGIYDSANSGVDAEYGKWASVLGQGLASVFGASNLGVTYHVLAGAQYPTAANQYQERLLASNYVGQAAPAQAGYLKQPAANGTINNISAVIVANYTNPTVRGVAAELQNAWGYYYTNLGNSAAQNANLNAYVDTLPGGANPTPNYYTGTKAWGAQYNVNIMFAYEGGYSPDLTGGSNWTSPITGATQFSSCVLTLASFNSLDGPGGGSGNPAVIGMVLVPANVGGMTQLNGQLGVGTTITQGSASIAYTGSQLVAGQAIMLQQYASAPSPFSNVLPLTPYFVSATGLTSTTFQISLTAGGASITPAGAAGGTTWGPAMDVGWSVTNVSGNSVTIAVNSTGFTPYTSGGTVSYARSGQICNNFRVQCLYAPDMYQKTLDSYNAWTAAGGTFPSQYELSGTNSVWPPIQPNIFGAQSQEFAAIVAYNH